MFQLKLAKIRHRLNFSQKVLTLSPSVRGQYPHACGGCSTQAPRPYSASSSGCARSEGSASAASLSAPERRACPKNLASEMAGKTDKSGENFRKVAQKSEKRGEMAEF